MERLVVVEANGSQVLPRLRVKAERGTVSGWHAHVACCDADQRTKHPEYRALADSLEVRRA